MLLIIWLYIANVIATLTPSTDLKPVHISGEAQGTTYQLTYYAKQSTVSKFQIDSVLNKIDSSLSIYKSYSLISQFNEAKEGIEIDNHFRVVVEKSLEIYQQTNGLFDITVQPLVQAWGFGPQTITKIPDQTKIQKLLHCTGSDKINLIGNYLHKTSPCIKVDVNGIAQGYSVDVLADFLEQNAIKRYVIEIGGEIRVRGPKPNGEKFSIGIESLDEEGGGRPVKNIAKINKGAITTSGNYEKFYMNGTKKISHLIDPKTGYPMENDLISVTIYARNAIIADGYDNALMGMGLKKAIAFAQKQKHLEAYFIYLRKDGTVADTATAGFYKLIKSSVKGVH
jgi:thiamine biosynthesis lipoprotein